MIERRQLLTGFAFSVVAGPVFGQKIKDINEMKPGDFTWHPEASPSGNVAVVVSLPEQRVHVYRNGVRIGVSTCSTGKKGHETPTGVFTILQKDKHHRSSTYNNAPMPNMNRLTWKGIALHAGHLPGYPASHGCIRLPMKFSEKLYGVTHIGTPVIIAGGSSEPWNLTHPGVLLTGDAGEHMAKAVKALKPKSQPTDWANAEDHPAISVIASGADGMAYLFRNGEEINQARLTIKGGKKLGEHVLSLTETKDGLGWIGVTQYPDPSNPDKPETDIIDRLDVPDDFRAQVLELLQPGLTLIITDLPAKADTRSGKGFVVITTEDAES